MRPSGRLSQAGSNDYLIQLWIMPSWLNGESFEPSGLCPPWSDVSLTTVEDGKGVAEFAARAGCWHLIQPQSPHSQLAHGHHHTRRGMFIVASNETCLVPNRLHRRSQPARLSSQMIQATFPLERARRFASSLSGTTASHLGRKTSSGRTTTPPIWPFSVRSTLGESVPRLHSNSVNSILSPQRRPCVSFGRARRPACGY